MIFVDYPGHFIAGLLCTVFAALIVVIFRTGELRKAKQRRYRLPLALLQYAAIFILLLILWNPSRPKVSVISDKNSVLVFFDTSESMSVVEDRQVTRLDRALEVFEENFHPLDADRPDCRLFGFDHQAYRSSSSDFLRRWGSQTNMHSILTTLARHDVTKQSRPSPDQGTLDSTGKDEPMRKSRVTGAVIFTDGQADDKDVRTYLPPNDEDFQIVIVGVGSRGRQTDIAIESLRAPSRVAIDTAYPVEVVVTAANLQAEPVTIELLKDDSVIDSRQISSEAFPQRDRTVTQTPSLAKDVKVEFTVAADRLGSYSLSAKAGPLEREVNTANNIRTTMVEVVEETRLKVLLYSQEVNFNIGKVRQALARDSKIQLDLGLDAIRTRVLSKSASETCGYVKLPGDRQGFYKYDVIILGPCDLDALTKTQIDSLYSFVVDRGGGLILLPGRVRSGPAAWSSQKAKSLLPVIFDLDEPTIWPSRLGQLELTPEGLDSRVISPAALSDCDEPTSPYYRIINTKPAAITLANVEDTPIVCMHRVGRGRVCLLNASKLFLWYREDLQGGLLSRLMAGLTAHLGRITSGEAGIELFADRADERPSKLRFEAYVCDKSFSPVDGANVLLTVGDEVLCMSNVRQGYYVAEVRDTAGQAVVATVEAEVNGVFLGEKTIAVNLPPAKTEMTDINLDERFLRKLAERLNGKYFYADEVGENIAKMFEAQSQVGTSRRMTSIWPNWPLFVALCMLLSGNWFLRRRIGLV